MIVITALLFAIAPRHFPPGNRNLTLTIDHVVTESVLKIEIWHVTRHDCTQHYYNFK